MKEPDFYFKPEDSNPEPCEQNPVADLPTPSGESAETSIGEGSSVTPFSNLQSRSELKEPKKEFKDGNANGQGKENGSGGSPSAFQSPSPNSITEEDMVLLLESDPLLRRQVRVSRLWEDEGALDYAARLFFCGFHLEDAAEKANVTPRRLRAFLKTDKGKVLAKDVTSELDEEFKGLYGDAIEVLRDGMRNPKAEIRLNAANSALRYLKEIKVNVELSAEDLVQKIMKGEQDGEA